jgi:hypothetical protein
VQANRRQNADRAEIVLKLDACQNRQDLGRHHSRGLAEHVIGLSLPLIRRTPEVARATLAVILPLVLVTRLLGAASRMVPTAIRARVIAVHKSNRTVRLPTGVLVVRAAPQHGVGKKHSGGECGKESAQRTTSTQ